MHLIRKAEASNHPASATGVTMQNQMQIKSGRHRGLGSLACISHCASALTHTFPKAAFLQCHNTIYGLQMLVLHIRSCSRQEGEALLVAEKCAPLLSKTLGCGSALVTSACMSPPCPIMWCRQTASPHSCHCSLSPTISQSHQIHFYNYTNIPRSITLYKSHYASQ